MYASTVGGGAMAVTFQAPEPASVVKINNRNCYPPRFTKYSQIKILEKNALRRVFRAVAGDVSEINRVETLAVRTRLF